MKKRMLLLGAMSASALLVGAAAPARAEVAVTVTGQVLGEPLPPTVASLPIGSGSRCEIVEAGAGTTTLIVSVCVPTI